MERRKIVKRSNCIPTQRKREGRASLMDRGFRIPAKESKGGEGGGLSTARLIFINYINSPRRGQPVDWVTRTTMYVLCLTPPSSPLLSFLFLPRVP